MTRHRMRGWSGPHYPWNIETPATEGEAINWAWDYWEWSEGPRRTLPEWFMPIWWFYAVWRMGGTMHMLELAAARWAPMWLRTIIKL